MRPARVGLATLLAVTARVFALEPPGQEVALLNDGNGVPVVAARAGGQTLRLAVDTGTTRSLVSASVAARLHLVPREAFAVAWLGGTARTGLCAAAPELRVGDVPLALDCLGWVPGEQRMVSAGDVDGLLGADALAAVDVLIDVRHGRLRVAPPGSLAAWVDGVMVPLERIGRRPALRVELPELGRGVTARLVIDSGIDGVALLGELARRAAAALAPRATTSRLRSAAGNRVVRRVPLGVVRAGDVQIDGGWAGLLLAPASGPEDGLLPLRLLGPALIDLSHGILVAGARLRTTPRGLPEGSRVAALQADR